MELPFTPQFIRKVEAFQTLKRLNKKFEHQIKLLDKEGTLATWEVEKKILKWTYWGHKHLASPIFVNEMDHRKSDMDISQGELNFSDPRPTFGNLVMKGYAEYYQNHKNEHEEVNQNNCHGIRITKEGLLMGELLNDVYVSRQINVCSDNFAIKYKSLVVADKYLFYKLWPRFLYESLIWLSYGALFLAAVFIIKEFWSLGLILIKWIFS